MHKDEYIRLAKFLNQSHSKLFNVILFDMEKEDYPILVKTNLRGNVIKAAKDFVSAAIDNKKVVEEGMVINSGFASEPGKMAKISVFFIKNEKNQITGALCLIMQCNMLFSLQTILTDLLQFNDGLPGDEDEDMFLVDENDMPKSPQELSLDTIDLVIQELGISVEKGISSGDKTDAICELYEMGIFELKGAVARTALCLNCSEKSVYRYISTIRKARES